MYFAYKWLHLLGLMMFFSGISATTLVSYFGKMKGTRILILTRSLYVLGMLILIGTGFLTLSAMGAAQGGMPLWVKLKLGVAALFVPGIILANLKGTWAAYLLPFYVILGAIAGALALFKPL